MNNGDRAAAPIYTQDMNLGDTAGSGLTKREDFAARAMQGILSQIKNISSNQSIKTISELSVDYADALLEALEAKDNE